MVRVGNGPICHSGREGEGEFGRRELMCGFVAGTLRSKHFTIRTRKMGTIKSAKPDLDFYEFVRGRYIERSLDPISGYVAGKIFGQFHDYLKADPFAITLVGSPEFKLRPGESDHVRMPRVCIVRKSRLPNGKLPETCFEFAPDLAVEVLSPTDLAYDVFAKVQEYLDAGTKIVWLARPQNKRITVFLPDGTETSFGPNDEITAEEVLPGFRMTVRDVFP